MIMLFGPPGAGKSVQGKLLAKKNGWQWLSAGQILRDKHDPELTKEMQSGDLADAETVNEAVGQAIIESANSTRIVMDGFPRELSQAKWFVASRDIFKRRIELVVVLGVPREELLKRLSLRARPDDTTQAIEERLAVYQEGIDPILQYFENQNIKIVYVDGTGTVEEISERIKREVEAANLI